MSGWDDEAPGSPAANKQQQQQQQQNMSDIQLAELSETISLSLKKFKDACALVGTSKDSSKLRSSIKSSREQLKAQLQRAAAECSSNKAMSAMQQQVTCHV